MRVFPLLRIEEDKAWRETVKNHLHLQAINGWLSCSWRTLTSDVCFQPQPQLIVLLIMMINGDDDNGDDNVVGKQYLFSADNLNLNYGD